MNDSIANEGQLFFPDTMLPSQYFAGRTRNTVLDPSHRLIFAVFQDAIECFQKHWPAKDPKARQLFDDACVWIWSDDTEWPYSFLNVCELLSFDGEYIRRGLTAWLENQRGATTSRVVPIRPVEINREESLEAFSVAS